LRNHTPLLLAGAPVKDRAVCGIRDGVDDAGAAESLTQAHAIGGNSRFRNRHGEAGLSAKNPFPEPRPPPAAVLG
jgi:hypothetical protein